MSLLLSLGSFLSLKAGRLQGLQPNRVVREDILALFLILVEKLLVSHYEVC